MEIPVYLICGFLESGKTSFVNTTLEDPEFADGSRILLIVCEEGIEEYNEKRLHDKNVRIVNVDDREDFTKEFLDSCQAEYKPDKVVIEVNGTWKMDDFLEMDTPEGWITVQIITAVNAATYQNYLANMRSLIMEQLKYADTVIFNRCDENTKKVEIRRSIKPINRKAQIIYETADGIDMSEEQEEMPFDIDAPVIEIEDDDFGLWYLDAMDYPTKYEGKKVSFKGVVYKDKKFPHGVFIPGRFAMTCCADDIAFIGFMCCVPKSMKDRFDGFKNREWVRVTGSIKLEFHREYRGKGPVIYAESIDNAEAPEEDVVYFN